jgi:hypothetical protein
MHKSAAKYEQSRTVRAATEQRRSKVDPYAFADEWRAGYDKLVSEKRVLEADIIELRARVARAKEVPWKLKRKQNQMNPATFQRWEIARAAKVRRIAEIEAELVELRRNKPRPPRYFSIDQYHGFNHHFYLAAKEILAETVFDRVRVAALHRLSEEQGGDAPAPDVLR